MTIYTVTVEGTSKKAVFDKLEDAVRYWDRESYGANTGGIAVMTTNAEGLVVRDGWILHVTHDQVYLNPNIQEA